MATIADGFVLVSGRGRDQARRLLEAADAVQADRRSVRTTGNGYLVPEAVAQYIEGTWTPEAADPEPEQKPAAKRRTRKSKAKAADQTETENKE